ncbi:MAG: YCF48-related protein [Chloroflexota bacterium]
MIEKTILHIGTENGLWSFSPIDNEWQQTASGLPGKKIIAINCHQDAPNILIAAVQGYGVFKTEDNGEHWRQVHSANAHCLLQDQKQPQRLWLGVEPAGVHRSVDGGQTWTDLTETIRQVPSALDWFYSEPPFQARLSTLRQHPSQENTILAGVDTGGIIRSDNAGDSWCTADEGADEEVHTLAVHSKDGSMWLATTGAGIYRSQDTGQTWHPVTDTLLYADPITILPSGVCLAGVASTPPGNWIENAPSDLMRSGDGGQHWEPVDFSLPGYISALAGDIVVKDNVYLGTDQGEVFLSQDQGFTWDAIAQVSNSVCALSAIQAT